MSYEYKVTCKHCGSIYGLTADEANHPDLKCLVEDCYQPLYGSKMCKESNHIEPPYALPTQEPCDGKKLLYQGEKQMTTTKKAAAFKVFEAPKEEPIEVYFKLKQGTGGSITLVAVDKSGKMFPSGNIINIKPDGSIFRCGGVNKTIGLSLDTAGKIKVT